MIRIPLTLKRAASQVTFSLCMLTVAGAADAGQRLAMVIGNGSYQNVAPAKRATGDAAGVAALLKDAGFTVIEKQDTDTRELKKSFRNLALALTGGDEVVIFYAGNAVGLGSENWLLPVDIPAGNDGQIQDSGVPLKDILNSLQEAKPHSLLVILDASRAHPSGSGSPGLVAANPAPNQAVLFSAATGKAAPTSLGEDDLRIISPFGRILLQEGAKPGVPLQQTLAAIRSAVSDLARTAGLEETPALFGQLPADVVLTPSGATSGQALASFFGGEEGKIWEQTDASRSEAAYQRYLRAFPSSSRAALARNRLDDLAAWQNAKGGDVEALRKYVSGHTDGLFVKEARAMLDEGELWEKATKGKDIAATKEYLGRYPQGRFVAQANGLLAQLEAAAAAQREEDAWRSAQGAGTVASFQAYLQAYPQGRFAEQARAGVEKVHWEAAAKANTESAYADYLKAYPGGAHAQNAREATEDLAWATAQKGNSEDTYGAYLKSYATGRYAGQAQDRIEDIVWNNAQKSRTLDLTRLYRQRYPAGRYATQAKDQEEDIRWTEVSRCDPNDQSSDAFRCDALTEAFIKDWPAGRHGQAVATLRQQLAASRPEREERKSLADAVATGEPEPLQAFLERFPKSPHYGNALEQLVILWQKKAPLPMSGTPFQDSFTDGSGKAPEMVALPAGSFTMGGTETLPERPAHPTIISHPFAIGKFELTFDDWDACVADKGCKFRPDDKVGELLFRWSGRGKMPVVNLVRGDIQQYLDWLSAKTGKRYRLPTEAEWEYAARAGTTTPWNFGSDDNASAKYAWTTGNSQHQVHPVGELAPSTAGLYDIYGNVAEWVQDCWHSSYEGAPMNGSVAWTTNCVGSAHVTRGGYFYDTMSNARSSSRARLGDSMRTGMVGLRIARDYP